MCELAGSIDAFPMRDEGGKLFMIWKEDGNSVNKPTPIWAQEMKEDRKALIGEKKELFRNDKGWEGNLVEGVSMIKKGDYYYAFYAAAGCCGRECTYQTGVARSKTLFGPWEKYDKNPILTNDADWKCPGHGTPIEKDGRYYFLYHAYDKETDVYTGREGLLTEFRFTPDGWIEFIKENESNDVPLTSFSDNFRGRTMSGNWQWSIFQPVSYKQQSSKLKLIAMPSPSGSYIGTKTTSGNYSASIEIKAKQTTASAGIGLIGDDENTVSALFKDGVLKLMQLKGGKDSMLFEKRINVKRKLYLQMEVKNGKDISFLYSTNGKNFQPLNNTSFNGSFLPPWDRSLRVGLIAKGDSTQSATFDNFQLNNQ
jgi:beta-xylosidase